MSRRRYLSTDISIDTAVNRLARTGGDFAVMLYTWMIPHCDDEGIVRGDAEEIILQVIPGRRDKSIADVTAALTEMQKHGLIEWDEEARCVTFPAPSFYKYQTYIKDDRRRGAELHKAPESINNANNTADQRKTAQNSANSSTRATRASLSHSHSHPEKEQETTSLTPSPSQATTREVFTALLTACEYDTGATLSKPERGKVNGAVKAIVDAGGDGAAVKERAAIYHRKYPDAPLTPPALASHWGELSTDKEQVTWGRNGFKTQADHNQPRKNPDGSPVLVY